MENKSLFKKISIAKHKNEQNCQHTIKTQYPNMYDVIIEINLNIYFPIFRVKYVCYSYRKLIFLDNIYIYILKILDSTFLFGCIRFQFLNVLKSMYKNFSNAKKGLDLRIENLILKLKE